MYVKTGLVPGHLATIGVQAQHRRERVGYKLEHATADEEEALLTAAERFVQIIQDHFAG